mmetsp:Transcript_24294/g.72900  ORF Transcript_24294/g.72900 Transcript_24294/m.72900 type:complete len:244 (+) Transcript_24294:938-1669(+)
MRVAPLSLSSPLGSGEKTKFRAASILAATSALRSSLGSLRPFLEPFLRKPDMEAFSSAADFRDSSFAALRASMSLRFMPTSVAFCCLVASCFWSWACSMLTACAMASTAARASPSPRCAWPRRNKHLAKPESSTTRAFECFSMAAWAASFASTYFSSLSAQSAWFARHARWHFSAARSASKSADTTLCAASQAATVLAYWSKAPAQSPAFTSAAPSSFSLLTLAAASSAGEARTSTTSSPEMS